MIKSKLQIIKEYSKLLNREVTVTVFLPHSYDGVKRYPVVYMHDGHNLFDPNTSSYGHIWQVDQAFSYDIQELIVVGIDAPQDKRRLDELCPYVNEWSNGKGDHYLDFLLSLKVKIDQLYLTLPEREHTGMIGSSMGGFISTYAMIKHNDVFSKYGLFSSAYWIDDSLLEAVKNTPIEHAKVYLDYGTNESGLADSFEYIYSNKAMIQALKEKDIIFDAHEYLGAEHNESEWAVRLPLVLRFLFGGRK